MVAITSIASYCSVVALLIIQGTQGCIIHARQDSSSGNGTALPPADFMTIGTDGLAPPETLGYAINHFSLIVSNLTASKEFYGNVLGMRHMFTAQLSPHYSVTYMGHAHGGRNGTGYQTGAELLREKNNANGMIEFQYFAGSADVNITATTRRPNTFSHIGLIVPSLADAEKRMLQYGVTISKRIGLGAQGIESVENAFGFGPYVTTNETERELLIQGQEWVGFSQLLGIEDPDGNFIEVQQLVPPPGVA
ncbi:hypothetical protein LTR84_006822 [Exophiala bonariae]|uniref:VOC domain-containing protein n=1 Tax=Exophiala bonariae TaxID=1690606 RepID=A0AAV9N345_9EURO|nr:hypothetical protein LTR84_006822 [Exophiala bonariae]